MAYGATTKTPSAFEKHLNKTEKFLKEEELMYKKLGVRTTEGRYGTLLRKYFPNTFEMKYLDWKNLPIE